MIAKSVSHPTSSSSTLRKAVRKHNRPAGSWFYRLEIPRKIYHATVGFVAIVIYLNDVSDSLIKKLVLLLSAICFSIEVLRFKWKSLNRFMFRVMGPLSRSSELTQLTGCFYYFFGILFSVFCLPKDLAFLAILYVAFCDPMASFVGRTLGKYTYRFSNKKTLAGAAGAFTTAYFVTKVFYLYFARQSFYCKEAFSLGQWSLISGIVAASAEIVDFRGLDDNFTIPVVSGVVLYAISKVASFLVQK